MPLPVRRGSVYSGLRHLHLQPSLPGDGVAVKNLQNEHAVVKHAAVAGLFDVFDLRRGELVSKQDELCPVCLDKLAELAQLALAKAGARVGPVALLRQDARHLKARRLGKACQLLQALLLQGFVFPVPKQGGQHRANRLILFSLPAVLLCALHAPPPYDNKRHASNGVPHDFSKKRLFA